MKIAFSGIFLAALAVTPSLGSILDKQNDLSVAIKVKPHIRAIFVLLRCGRLRSGMSSNVLTMYQ